LLNFFELAPLRRLVDLPGYGYASAPEVERRAWLPLIEALRTRASLTGLFVIVDSRRGLTVADEGLLAWALPEHRVHVLLSKADKLNHGEAAAVLRAAAAELSGRATAQLFSALKGTGVVQAQDTLEAWLACPHG
jgi:GTP-binding protein